MKGANILSDIYVLTSRKTSRFWQESKRGEQGKEGRGVVTAPRHGWSLVEADMPYSADARKRAGELWLGVPCQSRARSRVLTEGTIGVLGGAAEAAPVADAAAAAARRAAAIAAGAEAAASTEAMAARAAMAVVAAAVKARAAAAVAVFAGAVDSCTGRCSSSSGDLGSRGQCGSS